MKRIKVLLVDDHTIVREGIRTLLASENDIEVVGEAQSGREAVPLVRQLLPDVVVMDIAMPQLNGFEATHQICRAAPGTKVLILSAYTDDAYIERVSNMGASGYVSKQNSAQLLAAAIREIDKGNAYFSPAIFRRLQSLKKKVPDRNREGTGATGPLSPREMEVLQLVAEGLANKQVADELGISIKTVEKHRQHVMEKLNIHDTSGLTRYAISTGIIESSVHIRNQ